MIPILFTSSTDPAKDAKPPLKLFNTLTRKKDFFTPVRSDYVRMYNCGPTVYDYIHIGNLRAFVLADILRRTFVLNEYKVMQVMNITDVGHLTSDADEGEDKMSIALRREGKEMTLEAMREVSTFYMESFIEDLKDLAIKLPSVLPRASDHIASNIALIETLIEKEYAYRTSDGVYFDTARFPGYGKLGSLNMDGQRPGARVAVSDEKRSPADFALWKSNSALGWESPWGRGFPGWHIECSAMAMEYLGKELDVHTGGIDLSGTHHNNEIAQSECATGKPFARYWVHNEFVNIEGTKISKSLKNTVSLRHLKEHGYNPLAYRYWLMTSHYRTTVNFSFSALDASEKALARLHKLFAEKLRDVKKGQVDEGYALRLLKAMNDDLDTPKALALLWQLVKDGDVPASTKRSTLLHFDKVLGLGLMDIIKRSEAGSAVSLHVASLQDLPKDIQSLVSERESARGDKNWTKSDELRTLLLEKGYEIEDAPEGTKILKKH